MSMRGSARVSQLVARLVRHREVDEASGDRGLVGLSGGGTACLSRPENLALAQPACRRVEELDGR